jgi:hypothetical protein
MPDYEFYVRVELTDVDTAEEGHAIIKRVMGTDSHIIDHDIDSWTALSGDAPDEREEGDDDGVEYADPRDKKAGLE